MSVLDGIRQVRWPQAVDGVRAADSELRVSVTADGRVLNVLGSPAHDLPTDTTPELTAGEAVRAVQKDVGVYRSVKRRSGVRKVRYDDGTTAKLSLFKGGLAWRVTYRAASDAVYDAMVADSGKVLKRVNLVKSDAQGMVWDNHPGAANGGEARLVDLSPWLTSSTTLEGPYVHAFTDINDNDRVDASEEVEPLPYPFKSDYPGIGCISTGPCSWSGSASTALDNRLQNAVQAFYLANLFHDHLTQAPISFHGFEGADKVELQADDGAGKSTPNLNNANMYTPPDGQSPIMQMYLWSNPYRAMNGGDDASIVYHEYTHGLTNRLVTDADGAGALNSVQAGAMGEGWSDFYAKDFLVSQWPSTDTPAPGEVRMGDYTDRPGTNVIRNQGLDCPVGVTSEPLGCQGRGPGDRGGYTYGDFGKIGNGPEVHDDGEIWAETLWDLRTELGSPIAVRLITAALPLSPPEPSFLDMRNAILQADAASGGTYRARIWAVFAKRGMGFFASADDGNDDTPLEDFSLPPAPGGPRGTITGTVRDGLAPNLPLAGVTVSIGANAAGPDALTATTDINGVYTLSVPPGTYPTIVVRRTGYERVITSMTIAADETKTVDAQIKRDWAAREGGSILRSSEGSEYLSYGCGPGAAIDNNQSITWSTDYSASTRKRLVVELPQPVQVTQFGIDPAAGCSDSNNASMKDFTVETSPGGADGTWTAAASGSFTQTSAWHKMNAVTPTAGTSGVRWVRLTPINPYANSSFLDVSEFAVYGRAILDPPVTTIVSGPAQGTTDSDATPTFVFGSDEAGSTFECKLDTAAAATCPSEYTLPALADGQHTLVVTAINVNGIRGNSVTRNWTINLGFPDTTLNGQPFAYTKSTTQTFTFTGDRQDRFVCKWDTETVDPCVSGQPSATRTLSQGAHTFSVYAVNVNGADPTPPTRSFTVDSLPPVPTISSASVVGDSITFGFSAADATPVTFTCTFDGNTTPCAGPTKTYGNLADGAYALMLEATDAAGNKATTTRMVQLAAPGYDTSFTYTPDAAINYDDPVFEFDSPSAGATFECSLDGAVFEECESPVSFSGLPEGAHSFVTRAVGPGTRRDGTPARFDFTVDFTPPETILTLAPPLVLTTALLRARLHRQRAGDVRLLARRR